MARSSGAELAELSIGLDSGCRGGSLRVGIGPFRRLRILRRRLARPAAERLQAELRQLLRPQTVMLLEELPQPAGDPLALDEQRPEPLGGFLLAGRQGRLLGGRLLGLGEDLLEPAAGPLQMGVPGAFASSAASSRARSPSIPAYVVSLAMVVSPFREPFRLKVRRLRGDGRNPDRSPNPRPATAVQSAAEAGVRGR